MYRTKITLQILSEEPLPEEMSLDGVLHEAYNGDFVLAADWAPPEKLTDEEMAEALVAAGSEPAFFQIGELQ